MNIKEINLPATLSVEDLKAVIREAVGRTSFPANGLNIHKKYETVEEVRDGKTVKVRGKEIPGENDGFRYAMQTVVGTSNAPMRLHIDGGDMYSQNVRVSIDAFKLESELSAFAVRSTAPSATSGAALTFDAVRSALASKRQAAPASK